MKTLFSIFALALVFASPALAQKPEDQPPRVFLVDVVHPDERARAPGGAAGEDVGSTSGVGRGRPGGEAWPLAPKAPLAARRAGITPVDKIDLPLVERFTTLNLRPWYWTALGLVAVGLVLVALPVSAQGPESITISLDELNDSGISGTATLTANDGSTEVSISISRPAPRRRARLDCPRFA